MAQIISSIMGHSLIKDQLLSALKHNKLLPVYIFSGPSGIGKKKFALGMAQEILCVHSPACGECPSCLKIENLSHEALRFITPDGVQIKAQQAREIIDWLSFQKLGKARVIIIDEAHAFNPQAGNSLLKTLEEPPEDTYFFLITDSEKSLLPTIRSRSQIIRFHPLDSATLQKLTDAEGWILQSSQGRLDLIEQLKDPKLEELRKLTLKYLSGLNQKTVRDTFVQMKENIEDREQALFVISTLQQMLRDIFYLKNNLEPIIHGDLKNQFLTFVQLSNEKLLSLFKQTSEIESALYGNVDRNLAFENFILQNQESYVDR